MSVPIAVFASGGGTNLQALLDHLQDDDAAHVALVVCDRADAFALQRARDALIATAYVDVRGRDRDDVAEAMLEALDAHDIQLIVLAGYMRLVPAAVIGRYVDRILNIHPALLPSFGGRGMYGHHVHEAVIAAGCRVTGVTVHLVNERYDEGRILAQWPVPVLPGDTADSLAARVLSIEHCVYPATVAAIARRIIERSGKSVDADATTSHTTDIFRLAASHDGIDADLHTITRL
ncbi:phosphoribosylglycinamide formyltransferase [soil metagenome]